VKEGPSNAPAGTLPRRDSRGAGLGSGPRKPAGRIPNTTFTSAWTMPTVTAPLVRWRSNRSILLRVVNCSVRFARRDVYECANRPDSSSRGFMNL
jgi:hypothetical protein